MSFSVVIEEVMSAKKLMRLLLICHSCIAELCYCFSVSAPGRRLLLK